MKYGGFRVGGVKNLVNSLVLESSREEEEKSERREREMGLGLLRRRGRRRTPAWV